MLNYIFALVMLVIVLAAHSFGLTGAYVEYGWYDIMMHILGGMGIALSVIAFLPLFKRFWMAIIKKPVRNSRRFVVGIVIFVGIVWELFEIYFNITSYPLWTKMYYLDTLKDLVDDTIGALVVVYVFMRHN